MPNCKVAKLLFGAVIVIFMLGCGDKNQNDLDIASLEIYLNNHTYGPVNGCGGILGKSGKMTCGHPGAVSEISWQRISASKYRFTRNYPSDLDTVIQSVNEIEIDHIPLTVFKDDKQSLLIREKIITD